MAQTPNAQFTAIFPTRSQPAAALARLALVTVLLEHLRKRFGGLLDHLGAEHIQGTPARVIVEMAGLHGRGHEPRERFMRFILKKCGTR